MNTRDTLKEIKWIPIWKQRQPSGILVPLSWLRVMWRQRVLLRAGVIAVSLKLCTVVRSITLLLVVVGGILSRWWKVYEVVYGAVKVEAWRGITSLLLCCCFLCQKSDETERNVIVNGCKLGELFRSAYGVYMCNYVIGVVVRNFEGDLVIEWDFREESYGLEMVVSLEVKGGDLGVYGKGKKWLASEMVRGR